ARGRIREDRSGFLLRKRHGEAGRERPKTKCVERRLPRPGIVSRFARDSGSAIRLGKGMCAYPNLRIELAVVRNQAMEGQSGAEGARAFRLATRCPGSVRGRMQLFAGKKIAAMHVDQL